MFAIYASPRTSITGGGDFVCRRSGTPPIVRALFVISSPRVPSPRVTACTSDAVLVGQRDGHAVDFVLDRVFDRFAGDELLDPRIELGEFRLVVNIVDRQHGNAVHDGLKTLDRLAADLPRRTVGRIVFRMLRLELLQAGHQLVELEIA